MLSSSASSNVELFSPSIHSELEGVLCDLDGFVVVKIVGFALYISAGIVVVGG